jgi:hypothetical protein
MFPPTVDEKDSREQVGKTRADVIPVVAPEPATAPQEQPDQWASSRESLTPYATESSTRDLHKGFSVLERKLLMINMERDKCEADFLRLANRGVKTKKALEEKMYLEARLVELHKEASNVRVALKRAPK